MGGGRCEMWRYTGHDRDVRAWEAQNGFRHFQTVKEKRVSGEGPGSDIHGTFVTFRRVHRRTMQAMKHYGQGDVYIPDVHRSLSNSKKYYYYYYYCYITPQN